MSSLKNTMPNNRNTTDNRIEVTNRDRPKSPVSGNICPKLAYSRPISMKPSIFSGRCAREIIAVCRIRHCSFLTLSSLSPGLLLYAAKVDLPDQCFCDEVEGVNLLLHLNVGYLQWMLRD